MRRIPHARAFSSASKGAARLAINVSCLHRRAAKVRHPLILPILLQVGMVALLMKQCALRSAPHKRKGVVLTNNLAASGRREDNALSLGRVVEKDFMKECTAAILP